MLAHWRIKNFKSFAADQPDLLLSAINVLAGANSSGKSTIIQSILLLKQTLQYGSENRSIALNGPLLRLGAFDDVLNHDSESGVIELGFNIVLSRKEVSARPPWMRSLIRTRLGSESLELKSISLEVKWQRSLEPELPFGGDLPTRQRRTPTLLASYLEVTRGAAGGDEKALTRFTRQYPKPSETEEISSSSWEFAIELDDLSKQELFRDKPDASITGGYLSYFLPSWITIRFNRTVQRAIELAEALSNMQGTLLTDHVLAGEEVSPNVAEAINNWLVERGRKSVPVTGPRISAAALRDAIRGTISRVSISNMLAITTQSSDNADAASLSKLRAEIISRIVHEQSAQFDTEIEIPRTNNEVNNFIKEFFKQGVRYLGPLRDSPRPVYQLEALESTTDVGYRGEHTAAVLDLNGSRAISYVKPPPPTRTIDEIYFARASLHDAVVEWLVYLGVASEVITTDAGVFGHQLQVTTHSQGKLHDLTNVGVGVSQILPIVVMALLAPRGSLLIFEQPELHLHPRVQARLADFFIALAQDEKQLLLETHSEYLIDRFRLRIAESSSDSVRSLINILFSEKVANQSRLTPIVVNEYGAITNWPEDFFEQSQKDVGRIIRAAAEKRRTQS